MQYSHCFPWQAISRSAGLNLSVKLDFDVDAGRLRRDAAAALRTFGTRAASNVHHDGGWKGLALMAVAGNMAEDRALRHLECHPTPALEHAPYIRELLERLGTRIGRVRILSLDPGERVTWHYDSDDSVDTVWLRLHIPIWTNPGVRLQIGHEDLFWRPGEMWYGEFSYPHRLRNGGEEPRLHLVCDVVADEQTRTLLPAWYHSQRQARARWRPVVQSLCKAHQLATFRTNRTYAWRRRLLGRRLGVFGGSADRPSTDGEWPVGLRKLVEGD